MPRPETVGYPYWSRRPQPSPVECVPAWERARAAEALVCLQDLETLISLVEELDGKDRQAG